MGSLSDLIFFRNHRLCPRWMCFTFDNGFRRWIQNPDLIIEPFVREGDTVLDVGPGIGYFTIPMAKRVGEKGRVIAADIQESMLAGIEKRALRAGVRDRIDLYLSCPDLIYTGRQVDFVLAFWMAHEVPHVRRLFGQLYDALQNKGRFLLAEPRIHVTSQTFQSLTEQAGLAGFSLLESPSIPLSYAALFEKK